MKFTNETTHELDVTNVEPPITIKPGETVELPDPAPTSESPEPTEPAATVADEPDTTDESHKAARASKGTAK